MFTMNCTICPKTPDEEEGVRQYVQRHSPGTGNNATGAGMYFPLMIDTASEDRMTHLRGPIKIHDQPFPHLARDVVNREAAV